MRSNLTERDLGPIDINRKLKIFVSHKHSRAPQADSFMRQLNRLAPGRFDFFASSKAIPPGVNWHDTVKQKLESSDWLIALRSGGQDADMDWITKEITIFSEVLRSQADSELRRCIIVHDPDNRVSVFSDLQQFEASIDGCRDFLRHLLGTEEGCWALNRYVGNDLKELEREADRLWEILVDKPPSRALLPKAIFHFSADDYKELARGRINDPIVVTMNRAAAEIHGLSPAPNSDWWKGKLSDVVERMTKEQRDWIPLIAFLTRKIFEERRAQKAFLLYPDKDNENFYTPVVSEITEYASGEREYELIYAPVETGFPQNNSSERDLLFHLMVLCFNTHWRVIDRYKEKVHYFAAKERSGLIALDEEDKRLMGDLWKRILIDILKIHIEATARRVVNIESIFALFEPKDRQDRASDFEKWVDIVKTIREKCDALSAQEMEELLERLEGVLDSLLRSYSKRLSEML